MDNIYEIANHVPVQKDYCEGCNRKTIVYLEGTITPISKRLILERWLCANCLH